MIFKYSFQNCTSCSKRAVPVSVRHPIVRVTARNAVIATVVQITKAPSRTNTGRRRFAIEASSQTPYNPKIILFANKTIKGLTAPLLRIHPVFNPQDQVLQESRTSKRQTPNSTSYGTKRRHCHRRPKDQSTKPHEHRTPQVRKRSQLPLQYRFHLQ
jgi:hypothetical protein